MSLAIVVSSPVLDNNPTFYTWAHYFSVAVGGVSVSQTRDRIDDLIILADAISRQIPGSKAFDCQLVRNMVTKCAAAGSAYESYKRSRTRWL